MTEEQEVGFEGRVEFVIRLFAVAKAGGIEISTSQAAWIACQLDEMGYRKFEIVEGDV